MSIDYVPKIIIGTDIDNVTIDDEEIDDLLDDEYTRHGSYFSGEFSFIGKELFIHELLQHDFQLRFSDLKNEIAEELGVSPDNIHIRNGLLIM
ncbi:hypothetical protein [Providencia stuartii]|uniref:hypothetical protein n=1 Tax=Providencia stuartii TaxID=588 RepID=UPI0028860764|nr:hypothetical protein [Providencia stuartii]MDT1068184.1 hypothetical protein [Providencia stuartii]